MALTGTTNSPGPSMNTPTPSTDVLIAIRASIQPRTGWWQAPLRPWHYAVSIGGAVIAMSGFVGVLLLHGAHR